MTYQTYYLKGKRGHRSGPYATKEKAFDAACRLSRRTRTWVYVKNTGTRGFVVGACVGGKRKSWLA